MAKISYENVQQQSENTNTSNVSYFSLKNDGDEAIVRIMHDSVDTFDIHTVHTVKVNDKFRKVECIREPHQPLNACPLCEGGEKIQQRIYIRMIQYVVDNGQIVPKAVVWERPASTYAKKLKALIDEYGVLSDYIFKVKRNGAAGSMDTSYELMLGHPNLYPNDKYPKVNLFEGYNSLGHAVMNKGYNDMVTFINTGNFPSSNNNTQAPVNNIPTSPQRYTSAPSVSTYTPPVAPPNTADAPQSVGNTYATYSDASKVDTANNNSAPIGRPTRYY